MYETGKLYQVRESSVRNVGGTILIGLKGATVSITIYGSEAKPTNLTDMSDLAPDDSPFTSAGIYNFDSLPRYVAFDGTVTDIEVSNAVLEEIGDIS